MDRQTTRRRCTRLAGAAALLLLSGCSLLHWSDVVGPQSPRGDLAGRVESWRAGDWRLRRDWSPLAVLPEARRSGLSWSRRRWSHPSEAEWEHEFLRHGGLNRTSPARKVPESLAGHTTPHSPDTPSSDESADRFAGVPADLRVDLAIWLSEVDPRLSRSAADLAPIVATGRIRRAAVDWPELGPLFKGQSGADTAKPSDREDVSETTRLAAARAWCFQLAGLSDSGTSTESALIPAGQLLTTGELPPPVQAELLRTLGGWLPPGRIPRLAESLAAGDATGRTADEGARLQEAGLEAGLAWLAGTRSHTGLDATALNGADADWWRTQLRQMERPATMSGRYLYDANLVLLSDSDVVERLTGELPTLEWGERERVAVLIGLSRDSRGVETLQNLFRQSEDGPRLLALRGLATRDDFRPEGYADLPPRLRIALAECLAERDARSAASVAMRLIVDPHPQVASMMLIALSQWSAADATPILLTGLVEGSYKTRRDAFRRLQELHGPFEFSIDADVRARRDAALVLRDEWTVPGGQLIASARSADLRRKEPDAGRERTLQSWLDHCEEWATTETPGGPGSDPESVWSRFTRDDIPYFEKQLDSGDEQLRQFLGDELLPRLSPAYAAFRDLRSNELAVRRRAAATLRNEAANRTLPGPILSRLPVMLREEQDREVWRSTLLAVENEAAPEAAALARIAAETSWSDLRLLALDYAARHRPPGAVEWILPMLGERHPQVQREAVRVAGLIGDPVVIEGTRDAEGEVIYPGLKSLLVEANGPLRSAVILALAQLGDNQGLEELTRLARDDEPAIRAEAIRAMGETGRSRFLRPLVEILWTESSPTVQTAGLQALGRLVPEDRHPAHDATVGYADCLQAWADVVKSL